MAQRAHEPDGQKNPQGDDPWLGGALALPARVDLLSLVPLVAIVALLLLVGTLVWLVNRTDADRARTKLATDALWVEQTLRFQLSVDEDMAVRMALDEVGGAASDVLETRARLHIAANPEVLSLVWYDARGQITHAVPGRAAPTDAALVAQLLHSGAISTRPVYGPVTQGIVTFAVRARDDGGLVAVTISLPLLLERHIPWWIAEQYAVRLLDGADRTVAERVRRTPDAGVPGHAISFDPPLRGSVLHIALYARPPAFAGTLIVATIAALAAFAILALLALFRNASRRRRAELRLRGEMAFRQSMESSLTVGLRAKDHLGRILYVNTAFCNLVGWPAEDLIGRTPPMPYWSPDQMQETLARQQALTDGGALSQSFETRFRRRDGTDIDVQVYEAPLIDAQGTHRGWMGSVIDITGAKEAARLARAQDESLARTGRLVSLGEMASTLAHELNQPLSAIASYAAGGVNLMQHDRPDLALLRHAFEKMQAQARRAGQIIRSIQDFAKKREPRFSEVDLGDVVHETLSLLAADARENRIRLEASLNPVRPVLADRILLEQVLINLVRNGIEAMAADRSQGNLLTVSLLRGPRGGAVIEVADQGPGISADLRDQLFDPFTSSKPEGMGMGLNICRSIVELHRGHLTHRSAPGGGTVFSVALPEMPADAPVVRAAE